MSVRTGETGAHLAGLVAAALVALIFWVQFKVQILIFKFVYRMGDRLE